LTDFAKILPLAKNLVILKMKDGGGGHLKN